MESSKRMAISYNSVFKSRPPRYEEDDFAVSLSPPEEGGFFHFQRDQTSNQSKFSMYKHLINELKNEDRDVAVTTSIQNIVIPSVSESKSYDQSHSKPLFRTPHDFLIKADNEDDELVPIRSIRKQAKKNDKGTILEVFHQSSVNTLKPLKFAGNHDSSEGSSCETALEPQDRDVAVTTSIQNIVIPSVSESNSKSYDQSHSKPLFSTPRDFLIKADNEEDDLVPIRSIRKQAKKNGKNTILEAFDQSSVNTLKPLKFAGSRNSSEGSSCETALAPQVIMNSNSERSIHSYFFTGKVVQQTESGSLSAPVTEWNEKASPTSSKGGDSSKMRRPKPSSLREMNFWAPQSM